MPWPPHRQPATHACFPVGPYRLDAPTGAFTGLVEFSPDEYSAMGGKQFKGERSYHAERAWFLDYIWQVMIQTVDGQITKIATRIESTSKRDANPIACNQSLRFCMSRLGKPAKQKPGFFLWDAIDGNVILQTGETAEGLLIALFLTSSSVKKFEMLPEFRAAGPLFFRLRERFSRLSRWQRFAIMFAAGLLLSMYWNQPQRPSQIKYAPPTYRSGGGDFHPAGSFPIPRDNRCPAPYHYDKAHDGCG